MKRIYAIIILITFLAASSMQAQSFSLNGQVIGWSTVNPADPFQFQGGFRYIPEGSFSMPLGDLTLDGEASLDIMGSATYGGDSVNLDEKLDPYRIWVRLSGDQFEVRAGLQKINFGSANMIRPLMWFDKLDPKDPLGLTTGVYGLLGRYFFLNNANIWLWGLYGNNEPKGLEIFPSKKNSLELGGRVQLPLPIGEMAFTYHHRQADPDAMLPDPLQIGEVVPENRYAFDAKVDIGIGAWFEGALIDKNTELLPYSSSTLLNTGFDYTFSLGNGLNVMAEGLYYMQGNKAFSNQQEVLFGGMSLRYPINIIHSVSAMVFIDMQNREFYRFINWSMGFDRWLFYTIAFWNPETYLLPGFEQEANIFSGAGIQFMAVFNY